NPSSSLLEAMDKTNNTDLSKIINPDRNSVGEQEYSDTIGRYVKKIMYFLSVLFTKTEITKALSHVLSDRDKTVTKQLLIHFGLLKKGNYFIAKRRNNATGKEREGYLKLCEEDNDPSLVGLARYNFVNKLCEIDADYPVYIRSFEPKRPDNQSINIHAQYSPTNSTLALLIFHGILR
ncbi:unnamed protein product, partial [Didymodactylos carnosus]